MCCNRTFLIAGIILAYCSAAGCSVSGLFGPVGMTSIDAGTDFAFSDMAWNPQETSDEQDPPRASKPTAAPPKKSDQTTELKQQEEPRPKKVSYTRPKRKHRRLFLRSVRRWAPSELSSRANLSDYSSSSRREFGDRFDALQSSIGLLQGDVRGPTDPSIALGASRICFMTMRGHSSVHQGPPFDCADLNGARRRRRP